MIIHSPIISGSLTFANGASLTLPNPTSLTGTFTGTVNSTNGVISGSSQVISLLPNGTVSQSAQVNADSITNFDQNVKDKLNADSIVSSSAQITLLLPDGIVSSSTQISGYNTFLEINGDGIFSQSAQVNHDSTTGFVSDEHIDHSTVSITAGSGLTGGGTIAASRTIDVGQGDGINVTADAVAVDATVVRTTGYGVVSGSSQITLSGDITGAGNNTQIGTGVIVNADVNASAGIVHTKLDFNGSSIVSSSAQISSYGVFAELDGDNLVSGSAQITLTAADNTGFDTSYVSENASNLYYTDARVKTKLNAEAVLSGSTHSGNQTFSNNVTITGNLTVNGTTTTVNSNTVNIGDNILVLNSDETGTPSQNGGIEIERGTSTNASLIWDESSDSWKAGLSAGEVEIATISGTQTLTNKTISGASNTLSNIANASLTNSSVTVGSTSISLGATSTTLAGLTSVTSTTFVGSLTGNASTVTNGVYTTGNQSLSGVITFSNSTASTSKTTGAVIVTGGVGISGALNVGGDVVAYASSDERLKDNIELISNPIEKVQSLKGVTWNWNENADELQKSLPNVGVIAQDVEKVLPQLVHDRDNGFKGVDYAKLTGLLIEAIKEQQKQIDELKSKLS